MSSMVDDSEITNVVSEIVENVATSEQAVVGMVGLRSGKNRLIARESTRAGVPATERSVNDAGVIYTATEDMPSLEELLQRREVAYAVLERDVEVPVIREVWRERPIRQRPRWPVAIAGSLAGATTAVGAVALVDAVDENAFQANPYTALSLALGGIVLIATLLTALRSGKAGAGDSM